MAWLLQDLPDEWHVFHGIQLRQTSDLDHVVVGPTGVWCISTKSHRGLFSEQPDRRVFHNNDPTPFIGEATGLAKELKERLGALLGNDVPWVEAVLAVPLAWVDVRNPRNGVWVLHQDDLIETLQRARARLDRASVKRIAHAIEMLAAHAKAVWHDPLRKE